MSVFLEWFFPLFGLFLAAVCVTGTRLALFYPDVSPAGKRLLLWAASLAGLLAAELGLAFWFG